MSCLVCESKTKGNFCKKCVVFWRRFIWVCGMSYLPVSEQVRYIKSGMRKFKL